jgi:glycosyltransferase involved in cell wall biosynthesis
MLAAARALPVRHPPPAAPPLPLALVVPVWNDAEGLARLLAQVAACGLFAEVVVVDDGSDPPLRSTAPLPGTALHLIRHDHPQGGGVARNAGAAAVTQPWMMFLDADDLIAPDLAPLLADLAAGVAAGGPFDLCLFKHADARVAAEGRWGQPDWDEVFWARAGHAVGALGEVRPEARQVLAQTANYPWNKVYRTAFLRDHGIGCAATAVHQDIPLHWLALIMGRRVLASDRICVWHGVDLPGSAPRLSARRGPERLQVFAALDAVVPAAAAAGPGWQAAFAAFVPGLVDWAATRIDSALAPRLRDAEAEWMAARIGPWLPALAARDAGLAARVAARMAPR